MKLSKAQQEVVDKMREGWELHVYSTNSLWLCKDGKRDLSHTVWYGTFFSLKEKGIIYQIPGGFPHVYRLTEQYKTETAGKQ